MSDKTFYTIIYTTLCLFAFSMPFSVPNVPYLNLAPSFIALLLLVWLVQRNFSNKFNLLKTNKLLLPFCLCTGLYLLYVLGMLYTENLEFGLTDLLLKLPLLLLPIVIFTANPAYWSKKRVNTILKLFVLGNIILLFVSVFYSWMLFRETSWWGNFHYNDASWVHHPSYSSMFYCFSFVIIVYFLLNEKCLLWEKITGGIALILFSIEIILLDSRAGIMAFASVLLVYVVYILVFKAKLRFKLLIGIACMGGIFAISYKLLPDDMKMNRTKYAIEHIKENYISGNNSQEKYVRILIWDAGFKVATANLPFGTGTGDIKDELVKQYIKDEYVEPYTEKFNAHCQYLQIFATLGIAGIAVFLSLMLYILWVGCKTRSIIFVLFGLVMGINFLVESMFEKQMGIMFFSFFFTILCFVSQNKLLKQKEIAPS